MGNKLKTWGPVIGSAVLVGAIVLKLLGYGAAAVTLETVTSVLGISGQSSLNATDTAAVIGQLVAAGIAAWGILRKILSEVAKARATTVTPKP